MTKNRLIIFTRNPELGKVKTRLAKTIGNQKALEVYVHLLAHTKSVTENLICNKAVYYSVSKNNDDIWDNHIYEKYIQKGEDLGTKMYHAFDESFKLGYEKVLIIGSDLQDLTSSHIEQAFIKLNSSDVVVGPAIDGGYYLLGMKKTIPKLFENKRWGTSTVFKDTLKDLKNYKVKLLEKLNDIDEYDDLKNNVTLSKLFVDIQ